MFRVMVCVCVFFVLQRFALFSFVCLIVSDQCINFAHNFLLPFTIKAFHRFECSKCRNFKPVPTKTHLGISNRSPDHSSGRPSCRLFGRTESMTLASQTDGTPLRDLKVQG